ncbi:hypothetical protein METBIDRAFT_200427 [Metschnikowia bicuspidata var. bicuspidata NRRL YB-4993]|uniref:UPF3 domain-containing protein n=1 Tax=Metschnikowia bicuspidata var. bicuspidata NRRL YB-4993 TaxID=869754 RepID=A0A1A0H951_9ASCO|nr:hypothetical protein METBIDRAFT_200427 [Metschnikowia bicuspidata var. bicuspidata NRRL YB-4993]OBA20536.1 hypothetical protein METBIDRAFT_200427 [Metschnikowia bicuspidata var. bicuspidata NRRL YB-4993]
MLFPYLKKTAMEPSKKVAQNIKSKRVRRKQRQKKTGLLIEYGDPDTKVAVRLLPPTLEEMDFREQAEKISLTFRSGFESFTYKKGKKASKPFEEPCFSVAFVKFKTPALAENFKREISHVLFKETTTEDNIKCNVMRPIFGELNTSQTTSSEIPIETEVFKLFASLRGQKEGHVDIHEVLATCRSKTRGKKTKLKLSTPTSLEHLNQSSFSPGIVKGSKRKDHKHADKPNDPKLKSKRITSHTSNFSEHESKPKNKQKQRKLPESIPHKSTDAQPSGPLLSTSGVLNKKTKKKKKPLGSHTPLAKNIKNLCDGKPILEKIT